MEVRAPDGTPQAKREARKLPSLMLLNGEEKHSTKEWTMHSIDRVGHYYYYEPLRTTTNHYNSTPVPV
jgi:hypothetical protein